MGSGAKAGDVDVQPSRWRRWPGTRGRAASGTSGISPADPDIRRRQNCHHRRCGGSLLGVHQHRLTRLVRFPQNSRCSAEAGDGESTVHGIVAAVLAGEEGAGPGKRVVPVRRHRSGGVWWVQTKPSIARLSYRTLVHDPPHPTTPCLQAPLSPAPPAGSGTGMVYLNYGR